MYSCKTGYSLAKEALYTDTCILLATNDVLMLLVKDKSKNFKMDSEGSQRTFSLVFDKKGKLTR